MRTFQYSDAKSHKFWSIEVTGDSFTVTFGKVGTAGQTQTKTFASPEKAQAEADKLIKEKLKKGYTETTPKAAVSEAEAFEKALLANPDDVAAWSAYADYLAEQGDPRGEFMRVQLALEDESLGKAEREALKKREAALLDAHEKDWLGPLADVSANLDRLSSRSAGPNQAGVGHRFARGWLRRVEFRHLKVNEARALNRSPQARLLRELVVETVDHEAPVGSQERYIRSYYEPGPDVPEGADAWQGPGLHALCRCPHLGSVRVLRLGEATERPDGKEEEYFNCHMPGELAHHLVKQMPNLEELYLLAHRVDANNLFVLPMPNLRVLQLYHSDYYPLEKLAENKTLTKLTHILCHPHALEPDEDQEGAYIGSVDLRAICRSPHLKSLTHLRLRLTDFGDKGAEEIVKSGILKRLKVLDLRGGSITDAGAAALAACPDLKHLEFLDLSRNAMTDAGARALQQTGVRVNVSGQHTNTEPGEFGEAPEYLYEGDIE